MIAPRLFLLAVMLASLVGWWTYPAGAHGPAFALLPGPYCDLTELLAASREWVKFVAPVNESEPPYGVVLSIAILDTRTPAQKMRAEADQLERKGLAESRWRAAVGACSP